MIAVITGHPSKEVPPPLPHALPQPMPTAKVRHQSLPPRALGTQGTSTQGAHYQPVSKTPAVHMRHCKLMGDFNGQGNGRATVSGRRQNPYGAIGTPLPVRK